MYDFGNAKKNRLGLVEDKNKYEIENEIVDINNKNDSHSIIARELLKSSKPITVLDVGCGSGLLGKFFLNINNITLDGLEIDELAINHAKKIKRYRTIFNMSIEEFFKKCKTKYDYVIYGDVLEHLVQPDKTIFNTTKILSKNGKILISIPNIAHIDTIYGILNGNFNYNKTGTLDVTHLRFFTISSFAQMIKNINDTYNINLNLKLLDITKVKPKYIDENSLLFKILNANNNVTSFQYILEINQKDNLDDLKSILNSKNLDVYSEIERELNSKEALEKKYDFLIKEQCDLYNALQKSVVEKNEYKNLYYSVICSRTWKIMEPVRKFKKIASKAFEKGNRIKSKLNSMVNIPNKELNFQSESVRLSVDEMVKYLSKYDVISFDIFDTLIFRPFIHPVELFSLIENNENIDNFAQLRVKAETDARKNSKNINYEIDIYDIYNVLKKYALIDFDKTINLEWEYEKRLCYSNEYMVEIIKKLNKLNKTIVLTSDMYWPKKYLEELIKQKGYCGINNIYVSCEYKKNKGNGELQKIVIKDYPNKKIIHIGDNYQSDVLGSKKACWDAYYYKSCIKIAVEKLDPVYDMSLIESITSAIRYNYLYSGLNNHTIYYQYGFNYGGILTCGFLDHINKVSKNNNIDKILFLARDSKVFYDIYNEYYKEFANEYMIISRSAMYEACFASKTEDFIDFYFKSRASMGKYTISSSLIETDMKFLVDKLGIYKLEPQEYLNNENFDKFKKMIYEEKSLIIEKFESSKQAAINYFKEIIGNSKKLLIVDLGWSGSIISLMKTFIAENISKDIVLKAAFVGNKDSKKVNALIDQEIFFPYCFSYDINRDLYIDIGTLHGSTQAMLMEAMFTSTQPSLLKYDRKFLYSKILTNDETLNEIHNGIKKFAELYNNFSKNFDLSINSRSAFRPIRNALNIPLFNFIVFKNYKEYKDSLPHFYSERDITTIGKIMKDRNIL